MSIRILLADDHKIMRAGLRSLLEKEHDMKVVAEASQGRTAVRLAREHSPDIVIIDITMPDLNGVEAAHQILSETPGIKVVALSMHSDEQFIAGMLKAGASGYILKKAIGADLISAIRAVAAGESYLHPSIASGVIDGFLGKPELEFDNGEGLYDSLTVREKQVLKLIAEGCSHKEAATELDISVKTVISHQSNICDKLDIHSRAGLIKFAIQKGLIKL